MWCRLTRTGSPAASCSACNRVDAGLLVIAARWTVYIALLSAFGLALFGAQPKRTTAPGDGAALPLGSLLAALATVGLVASIVQIGAMAAAMAGVSIGTVDRQTLADLILGSPVGYAWLVRMTALASLGLAAIFLPYRPTPMLVMPVASSAIAPPTRAW